jgi:hypothetical protein
MELRGKPMAMMIHKTCGGLVNGRQRATAEYRNVGKFIPYCAKCAQDLEAGEIDHLDDQTGQLLPPAPGGKSFFQDETGEHPCKITFPGQSAIRIHNKCGGRFAGPMLDEKCLKCGADFHHVDAEDITRLSDEIGSDFPEKS